MSGIDSAMHKMNNPSNNLKMRPGKKIIKNISIELYAKAKGMLLQL